MNEQENLQNSLVLLGQLRDSSNQVFKTAAEGVKSSHGEEGKEKKFLSQLKGLIDTVGDQMKEVETNLSQPSNLQSQLPLSNLDSDSAQESFPLYTDLAKSYKWLDKAHDFAGGAASNLSQNSLKRSYGAVTRSRKRNPNNSHTAPPSALNQLIDAINKMFTDMKLTINRPSGTKLNAIVEVSLDRIFKAILIFKGLMIEWVVVKGYEEDLIKSDGQPDIWGESRYQVFQRITENANAAMLHFQSPIYPELAVKSFMTYMHSFGSLFSDKCKQCGMHLQNNLPPTWREFRTLEAYHEDCRP